MNSKKVDYKQWNPGKDRRAALKLKIAVSTRESSYSDALVAKAGPD
jgi:hypothetical protein